LSSMAALADEVDYTVYYMSAFSGRAETLHIMLADACAQWTTGSKDDLLSSQAGTCVFQVPAIKDHANGLVFSQTTTAVKYLAKKLAGGAYDVEGSVEEVMQASKIADDIADIWKEGYDLRKKKDAIKCLEWLNPVSDGSRNGARLTRLLKVINESRSMLSPSKKDCTYLLGEEVKYVDFLFYSALRTMAYCYGAALVRKCLTAPGCGNLSDVFDRVKSRENVKNYLANAVPVLYESVSAAALFGDRAPMASPTPLRRGSLSPSEMSSKNLTGYVNKKQASRIDMSAPVGHKVVKKRQTVAVGQLDKKKEASTAWGAMFEKK